MIFYEFKRVTLPWDAWEQEDPLQDLQRERWEVLSVFKTDLHWYVILRRPCYQCGGKGYLTQYETVEGSHGRESVQERRITCTCAGGDEQIVNHV